MWFVLQDESQARGDLAHTLVLDTLDHLGQQLQDRQGTPLFIISSLDYDNYLARVKAPPQKRCKENRPQNRTKVEDNQRTHIHWINEAERTGSSPSSNKSFKRDVATNDKVGFDLDRQNEAATKSSKIRSFHTLSDVSSVTKATQNTHLTCGAQKGHHTQDSVATQQANFTRKDQGVAHGSKSQSPHGYRAPQDILENQLLPKGAAMESLETDEPDKTGLSDSSTKSEIRKESETFSNLDAACDKDAGSFRNNEDAGHVKEISITADTYQRESNECPDNNRKPTTYKQKKALRGISGNNNLPTRPTSAAERPTAEPERPSSSHERPSPGPERPTSRYERPTRTELPPRPRDMSERGQRGEIDVVLLHRDCGVVLVEVSSFRERCVVGRKG